MKKFRIITSIVLSVALLAGLVVSFTTAPSTNIYAMSNEQTTDFFDNTEYLDKILGKEDSNKGSSDPKVVYEHISKFLKNNYSSLTKKKLLNEFDYLKDSAKAMIRAQLSDQSSIGKFIKRIENYINTAKLYWDTNVYNDNFKLLIKNFKAAGNETKRVFGSFRKEIKGKKPLDLIEYLLADKTHEKIVHHVLNIDGIIFKNVNVKTIIPKEFTNKKINQFTDNVKSVADMGISYNKMKKSKKAQVKHKLAGYINKPIHKTRKQINTALIQIEKRALELYKNISTIIKKKISGIDLNKAKESIDLVEDWKG